VSTEHSIDRPDARFSQRPEPEWAGNLRLYAAGASLIAGIVTFFLTCFLPGFLYGDLAALVLWGYVSIPVAMIVAPLSSLGTRAWLVRRVNAEVRRRVPERGRAAAPIVIATLVWLVVGAGLLVALRIVPNSV
jgi:hypothetical protein